MSAILAQLKGKLVVSCQASPGDPLDDTDALRRMSLAAIAAGAAGLRVNSAEHIAAVRRHTDVPIIGIHKYYGPDGLHITPDFAAAASLAAAGASIIALDCTDRIWTDGEPWQQLIRRIHQELGLPVMADVATFEEAAAAAAAHADCVGPTLNGYTHNTRHTQGFSWELLECLSQKLSIPIMAEGHISTPAEAGRAIERGAWCVIVGSAITRPGVLTQRFARAVQSAACTGPAIGVDIGGTSIKAGLVQRSGDISSYVQVPTDARKGRSAIVAGLVEAVERVQASARDQGIGPVGVGIATAGVVDHQDGSIFAATDNLPEWSGFPLSAFAQEQFKLPVLAVNDAQAAALSELQFGLGRSLSDFTVITIGTGVGGGIISGGKLLRGSRGFAGTIGHMVIESGGRACNCGRKGCLEAYVSTAALLREYREHGGSVLAATTDDAVLAFEVNRLAGSGDPAAQRAYAALAGHLAEAIANLFNVTDPQAVLLSGGLIEGYPQFVLDVETRVRELLHFGSKRQPIVRASHAGRCAGVQGAAALIFHSGTHAAPQETTTDTVSCGS